MKLEFRKPGEPGKVLGAGDYWLDNDEHPNLCFTGLWQDGKVVALVVGADEDAFSDHVFENCEEIVGRVNAYDGLVKALVAAESVLAGYDTDAAKAVRLALAAADRS